MPHERGFSRRTVRRGRGPRRRRRPPHLAALELRLHQLNASAGVLDERGVVRATDASLNFSASTPASSSNRRGSPGAPFQFEWVGQAGQSAGDAFDVAGDSDQAMSRSWPIGTRSRRHKGRSLPSDRLNFVLDSLVAGSRRAEQPREWRPKLYVRTVGCLVAALPLAMVISGCRDSNLAANRSPTSPSTSQSSPASGDPSLTGTVFEATSDGRRPLEGARIFVVDLEDGPYGYRPWYELRSDATGRFSTGMPGAASRVVKVTAFAPSASGPIFNGSGLFQLAAVRATIAGATTVEIELVSGDIAPRGAGFPLLSGVIFERTAGGRRPAADMAVLYSSRGHDGADVYGRTDAEGRYRFYGVPTGDGYLSPACTRATTLPLNFRALTFPVTVAGDTVLDATCE